MRTTLSVIRRRSFPTMPATARLPGQSRHVGNVAASYEKGGFSGRVSVNFHGSYIDIVGADNLQDRFYDTTASSMSRSTRKCRAPALLRRRAQPERLTAALLSGRARSGPAGRALPLGARLRRQAGVLMRLCDAIVMSHRLRWPRAAIPLQLTTIVAGQAAARD